VLNVLEGVATEERVGFGVIHVFFCVGRFLAKFECFRCRIVGVVLQLNDSYLIRGGMCVYGSFPKGDKCEGLSISCRMSCGGGGGRFWFQPLGHDLLASGDVCSGLMT
jgi:hypothetical protein